MITINEQRTIREIHLDPTISLRGIVEKVGLGGVASASHIINSLQTKGYLEKVGVSTNKKYRLTPKALALKDIIEMKVDDWTHKTSEFLTSRSNSIGMHSTTSDLENVEKFHPFSSKDFPNSTGEDETGKSVKQILSASFTRIMSSPEGIQKYGDVLVLAGILTVMVLPICSFVLKDQWMNGFLPISLILLTIILLNKKI